MTERDPAVSLVVTPLVATVTYTGECPHCHVEVTFKLIDCKKPEASKADFIIPCPNCSGESWKRRPVTLTRKAGRWIPERHHHG